ncbi:hypothetical protein DdX_14515 [Ditylenchus destructor]|uniref:EB1 C-terminal domain-containing protein n=1 Tax=Ditylenchus destructor TaxID=166010 RepID=A0AAD4MQZ2_9BILA|nr:hypothetical protein DdX_14515 [Ditylenchus destructor]
MRESSSVFERERDFYFAKLRAIELLCEEVEQAGGQLSNKDVQAILYDENDATSPLPRGDVTVDLTHTVMDKTQVLDQTHSVNNSAGSDLIQIEDAAGKDESGIGIQKQFGPKTPKPVILND